MEETENDRPPGLRFDKRGRPFWRATKAAIAAGYPVKNVDLSGCAEDLARVRGRCIRLQREMTEWLTNGGKRPLPVFNGTFGSLLDIYVTDPKSPYHALKHSTTQPYDVYIRMMKIEIGRCRLDRTDGIEVKDWFDSWAEPEKPGDPLQLAKAHMAIAALKAALSFGVLRRLPGCAEFKAIVTELSKSRKLPRPKARKIAMTADQIIAARQAAHEIQHPRAALAYAMQFEGAIRKWDVFGKWVPLNDRQPSAVIFGKRKWIGPTWANVDENLILRWTPTKTEDSTGVEIIIDLRACPMVMEELQWLPQEERKGPLIVNHETGRPYTDDRSAEIWREVRKSAGISSKVWNRDIRKSGSTEARAGGAAIDDLKKTMGHSANADTTERVYDLANLEAFRRVAEARKAHREKK